MNTHEAASIMNLEDYRLWWYRELGITPPEPDERLTVRQATDERIIREGYQYRRRQLNYEQAKES